MQQESLSDESSDSENSDSDDEEGTSFRVSIKPLSLILTLFSFTVMNGRYKNVSQLEWDNSTL